MVGFELNTHREGSTVRIALRGELDIASAERVEEELAAVEDDPPAELVLDLSGLEFMDSTGLRLVLGADARARAAGRSVTIVRGSDAVTRLFRITGLEDRLTLVDAPPA